MIKRLLLATATLTLLVLGVAQAAPVSVLAATTPTSSTSPDVCNGITATGAKNCTDESGITNVIRAVITILSFVVGVASVIMIIIGGLKYVTSNGDASAISSAKNTIIYAVVGLVVALLAQSLVIFVFKKASTPTTTSALPANSYITEFAVSL